MARAEPGGLCRRPPEEEDRRGRDHGVEVAIEGTAQGGEQDELRAIGGQEHQERALMAPDKPEHLLPGRCRGMDLGKDPLAPSEPQGCQQDGRERGELLRHLPGEPADHGSAIAAQDGIAAGPV